MMGTQPQDLPQWAIVRCPNCGARFVLHQVWPRFRGRIVNYNASASGGPEGYLGVEWLDEHPSEDVCQDLMVQAIEIVAHRDLAQDVVEGCADRKDCYNRNPTARGQGTRALRGAPGRQASGDPSA